MNCLDTFLTPYWLIWYLQFDISIMSKSGLLISCHDIDQMLMPIWGSIAQWNVTSEDNISHEMLLSGNQDGWRKHWLCSLFCIEYYGVESYKWIWEILTSRMHAVGFVTVCLGNILNRCKCLTGRRGVFGTKAPGQTYTDCNNLSFTGMDILR